MNSVSARHSRRRFPLPLLALAAASGAMLTLVGCGTRTTVLVRNTDETAYAGRVLGGYHYPTATDSNGDGKDTVTSVGSPTRLTAATRVSDVRSGDQVADMVVGAYVDPANPNLLHQPHHVMRLDHSSRWKLAPASEAPLLHGPTSALRTKEYSPTVTEGEASREIMATRRAMEATGAMVTRVEGQQRDIVNTTNDNNTRLNENQVALLKLTQKVGEDVKAMKAKQDQGASTVSTPPSTGPRMGIGGTSDVRSSDGKQSQTAITKTPTVNHVPAGTKGAPASGVYDGSSR